MGKCFLALLLLTLPCISAAAELIDLNSATQAELESLPGIGPGKARAIIDYRNRHGALQSIEELDRVSGFGGKTIEKIRPFVAVGNSARPPSAPTATSQPAKKQARVVCTHTDKHVDCRNE
jgi:competence protein ComEA